MKPFRIPLFLFLLIAAFAVVSCKDPFLREDVEMLEKREKEEQQKEIDNDSYIREVTDIEAALDAPNCIMVKPGEEISIPVAKAFAVWQKHQKLFGKKFSGKGDLAPVLVWALPNDLVDDDELEITGYEDINKAAIRVKTKPGAVGNALVALAVQGEIRWSWHLWVTEYNPGADISLEELKKGPNNVPGGNVFRYKNYCGDNIFMDRNLGANGTDKNKPKEAIGMYYQWGRKDPFPGFAIPNFIPADIYDLPAEYRKNNLAYSIEFPDETINASTQGLGSHGRDWYSYYPIHNNDLWGWVNSEKTIYDPCPEGWRVPFVANTQWGYRIENSPFFIMERENWYVQITPDDKFNCESPVLGFFPETGYLFPGGDVHFYRSELWTASPFHLSDIDGYICRIAQDTYHFDVANDRRHYGYNIRCIRDLSNKQ